MSAKTTGEDPEVPQIPLNETDEQTKKPIISDRFSGDLNSFVDEKYNTLTFENTSISRSGLAEPNPAKNKRKNFNPRYTSIVAPSVVVVQSAQNSEDKKLNAMDTTTASIDSLQSVICNYQYGLSSKRGQNMSGSSTLPPSSSTKPSSRGYFSTSGKPLDCVGDVDYVDQRREILPWMQMLCQYEQLVRAAGLPHVSSAGAAAKYGCGSGFFEIPDWIRKFGNSESAVTAISDILKEYKEKTNKSKDGSCIVNLQQETEPPTPPTTPHTCNSLRPVVKNGEFECNEPPVFQSPPINGNSSVNEEVLNSTSPTGASSIFANNSYPKNLSYEKVIVTKSDKADEKSPNMTRKAEKHFEDNDDNSWDCCGDRRRKTINDLGPCENIQQWCNDFEKIQPKDRKRIKSECGGDTDTTVGDIMEVSACDEEDYPPLSLIDFPDSTNDGDENDDDEGDFSFNIFGDDDQSEADDGSKTMGSFNGSEQNNADNTNDIYENPTLVAEKEGNSSNSSSRISVRNLQGFYEQDQVNPAQSKSRCATDDKLMNVGFVQNMNKFSSYVECQNEMCRLENLREHYHCYDYPCFGKILSKKEEVIRHVKWHRKRMESLNHGFMRFSSSDDCSTTYGNNCQHNRKQTHYHCFQPNCDRVYISTSDVQMHSNFHRKNSAIHKEGFQRFRANERCGAEHCMFADQKTTHFHCRRDNCQHTFKNKADMEKHKTYHIKDLKLAQDGFKKFLKNEACPYKQCRFSKICNHIHCARDNCFYVLHSSGQLLSHKRKHERMDYEQTYCRYKMLAVKAALLGNVAAAATVTPKESTYNNFDKSLLCIKEFELNTQKPKTGMEPSLSLPKKDQLPSLSYKKDECNTSPNLSKGLFQQLKNKNVQLLNQKLQHHSPAEPSTSTGGPDISMFPIAKAANSPQHQYNTALHPTQLTPSIIQQYFTTECFSRTPNNDEPEDGPACETSSRNTVECPWKERLDSHLHCIIKDCDVVIPNNILDISAHIRIHEYNRDVYATSAASESIMASGSNTAPLNNPMQITTIDGFFNRKRGRPPKNRFVEVYKNAQQPPQAIFTSFKLEKQSSNKDSNNELLTSDANSIGIHHKKDDDLQTNNLSPQKTVEISPMYSSQFNAYKANQNCLVVGGRCPLAMENHYHCIWSPDCTFATVEMELLSVHLERQHTTTSIAETISKKFKRFDRNIGLDCGIVECRLRKTRPHLHCRQCYRQISPFDLEAHVCHTHAASSPTEKTSFLYCHEHSRNDQLHLQTESVADRLSTYPDNKSLARLPSVTFSTINELRKKVSEMEPDKSSVSHRQHIDEKIWVRAAGTYFPENTGDLNCTGTTSQQRTLLAAENLQLPLMPLNNSYCSTPYCKLKRRFHEHCEFCDQSFVDPAKCKEHKSKHIEESNQPEPNHSLSLHSSGDGSNPTTNYVDSSISKKNRQSTIIPAIYDEQPQDLSVFPITTTPVRDIRIKSNTESIPDSPTVGTVTPVHFPNMLPQELMSSLSLQNFHLGQLASLYQQNPYYNQHLHPLLLNASAISHHHRPTPELYSTQGRENRTTCLPTPAEFVKSQGCTGKMPLSPSSTPRNYPFLGPFLMARNMENIAVNESAVVPSVTPALSKTSSGPGSLALDDSNTNSLKRKLGSNGRDEFTALMDALSPSTKKQMQFAAGLVAVAAAAAKCTSSGFGSQGTTSTRLNLGEQHGQHYKIKDEQIPTGYLKFRFNEDCYFPKCGYRNHQSHFHCDRNDCHYSFCDKTRFVQHTARHERLDKLMGNDFRQYRANMNCGYENCPYFKNLGSANKSSHFHCLKCEFICSDTNKVVAHRRQHSKMEFIRMAGFRKVTNSEKCNSSFEATVATNGNELPGTVECSYSQKQTHYHCLVCDVSVLSRAQLGSHKHKT